MLQPAVRIRFPYTHLVRGGAVMLQPRKKFAVWIRFPHTHLVRGASVMLQPTKNSRYESAARIPTSLEVGRWCCSLQRIRGTNPLLVYPPRQRWVGDAAAYKEFAVRIRFPHTHLVRGGLVMLQPTRNSRYESAARIPTSSEVGWWCCSLRWGICYLYRMPMPSA